MIRLFSILSISLITIISLLWLTYCEPPLDALLMVKFSANKQKLRELARLLLSEKHKEPYTINESTIPSSENVKRVLELMKQLGVSSATNTGDPSPEVFLQTFSVGCLDWAEEKGYFHSRYKVDLLVRSTDWSKIGGYQYRYLDDGWYVYYYQYR